MAVLVDSASISGWAGWEHAGDDHVAGPLDIVRRSDGHDVLLPWCTERVSSFFGRRVAADAAFSSGEMTTLVASILRGMGELARGTTQEETGEWWITDDGRPTFVIGAGETARSAGAALVARLRRDCADRTLARLLVVIEEGLTADSARPGMPVRQLEKWEAELFDTAAPKPLRLDVHAPELARDADAARHAAVPRTDVRRPVRSRSSLPREVGRVRALSSRILTPLVHRLGAWRAAVVVRLERHGRRNADRDPLLRGGRTDAGAGERVGARGRSRARAEVGGRAPVSRGRRTIVAAGAAAVVLAGGFLWPGGATGEPAGRGAVAEPKSTPRATEPDRIPADPSPTPSAPAPVPPSGEGKPHDGSDSGDPVEAARSLIDAIGVCSETDDAVCAGAVADGSAGVVEALGDSSVGTLQFEPVDEYGDVAVIRVSSSEGGGDGAAPAEGERMVVLVRITEKWLVRDVYDVADPPG